VSAPEETAENAPCAATPPSSRDRSTHSRAETRVVSPAAALALAGINLLWGGSLVAAKYALTAFGPFTLTAMRFFPASLLLLAAARAGGHRLTVRRADWPALFLLGSVSIALTYGVFYIGADRTSATDASLLFACEPILIALFAGLFLRERLTLRQWNGLLLGVLGIWLIAGQALGNRIALLALCFETAASVLAKRLASAYPGLVIVSWQMLIGSSLLLPVAGWELAHRSATLSWQALGGWLYLSLLCSALCYGIWYHFLTRFPVSAMGVFILLQPVVGPLYGRLFLGESLRPGSALGGALVLLGIALTTLARKPSSPVPP